MTGSRHNRTLSWPDAVRAHPRAFRSGRRPLRPVARRAERRSPALGPGSRATTGNVIMGKTTASVPPRATPFVRWPLYFALLHKSSPIAIQTLDRAATTLSTPGPIAPPSPGIPGHCPPRTVAFRLRLRRASGAVVPRQHQRQDAAEEERLQRQAAASSVDGKDGEQVGVLPRRGWPGSRRGSG